MCQQRELKVPFIYFSVMKARFVSRVNIRAPPFLATDNSLGMFPFTIFPKQMDAVDLKGFTFAPVW